jgi:outer membrane receptor for ferric coprogen and ferric-rhodotorulic acid
MNRRTVNSQEELYSMELVFEVLRLSKVKYLGLIYSIMNSETVYANFTGIFGQEISTSFCE